MVYLPLAQWPLPVDNRGARFEPEGKKAEKSVHFAGEEPNSGKPLQETMQKISKALKAAQEEKK